MLFTQVIIIKKKQTQKITKALNLVVQYLEKYSSTVQQLVYRGWHQVNRQEELLTEEGEGGDRWQSWRIASNRRRRGSCNYTHAWHGKNLTALVPCWIQFYLPSWKKKQSRDVWIVALFFSHHRWPSSTRLHSQWLLQPACTILHSSPVLPKLTVPPHIKKILLPLTVSWISSVLQLLLPLVSLHPFSGPPIPSGLH